MHKHSFAIKEAMKKILIPLYFIASVISAGAHCGGCGSSVKKGSHLEVSTSCCSDSGSCCKKKSSDEKKPILDSENSVKINVPMPKMACCPVED